MIRGMELHPKGTGKIQMRLLHHYVRNCILLSCLSIEIRVLAGLFQQDATAMCWCLTDLLAEPADPETEMLCGVLWGVFAQQVHTVYPGACKCTNSAKVMEQGRAEFPKSVGWMVLWESILVLPQECILVLQWGWWWWGHFGRFSAKPYIRKIFFHLFFLAAILELSSSCLEEGRWYFFFHPDKKHSSAIALLGSINISLLLQLKLTGFLGFFWFFFPLTRVPIPKSESDVEVLLVNC